MSDWLRTADAELAEAEARLRAAERAFNRALREAAERDLEITLEISRQDLEDDNLTMAGDAPAVEVTVRRYEAG